MIINCQEIPVAGEIAALPRLGTVARPHHMIKSDRDDDDIVMVGSDKKG